GAGASASDGTSMWVPVRDEQVALLTPAAHGVGVAPGGPFQVRPLGDHVRVTVGLVRDGFDDLADILAEAAGARHRASGPRSRSLHRGTR
ncbi:GntR family transcriptional regulator, partial [Micromonospora sp. CPCC 205371]|nr:GntR family transcriptional regulator [Micromonospora sp. CPCC 205371]